MPRCWRWSEQASIPGPAGHDFTLSESRRQSLSHPKHWNDGSWTRASPSHPAGVALQVQRLRAVGLRDAGVADQPVSQTNVCDM